MTCNCGKPTRDESRVCDDCLTDFTKHLAEVPWLVDQLEISMTRQKGVDYTTKVTTTGGSKETPLPVHFGAFSAASQLRASMLTWTQRCHAANVPNQSPKRGLPILDTVQMSRWLMWRVDGMGLQEWGPSAADDVARAVEHGHRVIDRPADKWFAGPCHRMIEAQPCGRDLYVTPGKPRVECPACGADYDVNEQRDWLYKAAQDHLATADEIARAITVLSESGGTTTKTLRRLISDWRAAGHLAPRGHVVVRGKPSTLYRVGDVSGLVQGYINRKEERLAQISQKN